MGIVAKPVQGAEKGGLGGFFGGVARGLVGAVVAPVTGTLSAFSKVRSRTRWCGRGTSMAPGLRTSPASRFPHISWSPSQRCMMAPLPPCPPTACTCFPSHAPPPSGPPPCLQVTEGLDSTYSAVKSSINFASARRGVGRRRLPRPFTGKCDPFHWQV